MAGKNLFGEMTAFDFVWQELNFFEISSGTVLIRRRISLYLFVFSQPLFLTHLSYAPFFLSYITRAKFFRHYQKLFQRAMLQVKIVVVNVTAFDFS